MEGQQYSKYEVTVVFHKLYLAISFPCEVSVSVKRGNKKYALKKSYPLDTQKFKCDFNNSPISFTAVFSKETRSGRYLQEKYTTSIVLVTQKGNKNAGHLEICPTEVLDKGGVELVEHKAILEKCPDKKAAIVYSLNLKKIKDLSEDEFR